MQFVRNLRNANPLLDNFCSFIQHRQRQLQDRRDDAERDGVKLIDCCQHGHWLDRLLFVGTMRPNGSEAVTRNDTLEQLLSNVQIREWYSMHMQRDC